MKKETDKLRKTLAVLRRLYYKVPVEGLKPIAEGIFNSHLRYGIILTEKPRLTSEEESNSTLKELQTLQNEMQRIILGIKREDRVRNEDVWERSKMQTVNHMACYHNLMEMHNIIRGGASETLHESLRQSDRSDRVTRSQTTDTVKIPMKSRNNGFTYFGAKLWNRIPEEYKNLKSGSFKTAVKEWITDNIPLA